MIRTTLNFNHPLLDPLPNGGGMPDVSSGKLATIRLDETDHNRDLPDSGGDGDTPTAPAKKPIVFDADEILGKKPATVEPTAKAKTDDAPDDDTIPEEVAHKDAAAKVKEKPALADAKDKPEEAEEEADATPKEGEDTPEQPAANEQLPPKRDVSQFDAMEAKVLKNMKNDHFAFMSKRLMEYKQSQQEVEKLQQKVKEQGELLQKGGVPSSWYDHPLAFTLTPEYTKLADHGGKLEAEKSFYEAQLVNILEGKEFVELTGYTANGQPQFTPPRKPNNQDQVRLNSLVQQYATAIQMNQSQIGSLQGSFQQQHKQAFDGVNTYLDTQIGKLIPELRPTKEAMKVFTDALPPQCKERIPAEAGAKMYGIILQQAKELAKYKEKELAAARRSNDRREAGVNTTKLPKNGINGNGTNGSTFKLKNGREVPAVLDVSDILGG